MSTAYYSENDPFATQWLRNLIDAGEIAPGIVDTRSIADVRPEDLDGTGTPSSYRKRPPSSEWLRLWFENFLNS